MTRGAQGVTRRPRSVRRGVPMSWYNLCTHGRHGTAIIRLFLKSTFRGAALLCPMSTQQSVQVPSLLSAHTPMLHS